jgi:WD40 repeat protein
MRRLPVFLVVLLILTGCAAPAQPTTVPTEVSIPELQAVTVDGTLETSLLASTWADTPDGGMLFPLDPSTGKILPGYEPIPLGYTSTQAFSPDRQTLAVISFPDEKARNGSLVLIDLPAWKTRRFELELHGWVNSMVFSPDGKRLAIAHGESSYRLTIVDLEKGTVTAQERMKGFLTRLKFTRDGAALMVYSPSFNTSSELRAAPPEVFLLDTKDLTPRWSAELEGVHDGIFAKDDTITPAQLYEPGNALYLSPGLVFAPDRDALYVVHPDSEQLTTVDFQSQTVSTVKIQPTLTWFERLLSLSAGIAHAKIADGTNKQAHVSPDGRFLYVIGSTDASFQDGQGNWQMQRTPLGLEILQTSDGSRIGRFETDATDLSLSPDGRFLYLRKWEDYNDSTRWTEIFDTSSRQFGTRKAELSGMSAQLMNGDFLLVSTYSTSETSHHMSVLVPDGSSVLAEWTDRESIYWVTP